MDQTKRSKDELLRSQLVTERSSFDAHWKDLSQYIAPRRSRFFTQDANRGDKRMNNIIDSTATQAARTLRAGMMAGITSPARPWFRLTTPDSGLAEYGSVKTWLDQVTKMMNAAYLKSNIYNSLPSVYGDMGNFGTGAVFVEEDFESVLRSYSFPIGSYYISTNPRLMVDTFLREFRMTVRQVVEKFGKRKRSGEIDWSNLSLQVKSLWETNQAEQWIDICHIISPNEDFDPKKPESKFKRYASRYYERGYMGGSQSNYLVSDDGSRYLLESGYDQFPVLCPRWEVAGEDVYGTNCPGMEALGDIRQLQLGEKRKMQAIEKMINPPMVADVSLRQQKVSILPADITYVSERDGRSSLRAAHEINFRIEALEATQQQVRGRIKRAFYEDLFLMFTESDRRQVTATEIDARKQEQLLVVGPVLEQLNQDLLDPLIDLTFGYLSQQGKLPPAPEELQGMPLRVEYISFMAQAQKSLGIAGVERFTGFVGNIAAQHPEVMDKVDVDQLIDVYSDLTAVPVGIVRSDEDVEKIRGARAKAQQAQQMAENIPQMAGAAKDLSQTDLEGNNALSALVNQGRAGAIV